MSISLCLREIKKLEGTITLKSGLRIGSGDTEMHIGGVDNPIIRHPHTLEPYIPGSSLKGKVRSLLEMESGLMIYTDGKPLSSGILKEEGVKDNKILVEKAEAILKIFGLSGADREDETGFGPTRVSFADCYLDDEWKKKAVKNNWPLVEVKAENAINRIKGVAEHPRFMERVPAGAIFNLLITFKVLEEDDRGLLDVLLRGLKLLEMDALGGCGSRGYGRIEIEFKDPVLNNRFKDLDPFKEVKEP